MSLNAYGAVNVADFAHPDIITLLVQSGAFSGGQLIGASGTPVNPLSSGISSYQTTDLYAQAGSNYNFVGIALDTVSSGTTALLSVATNGLFIVTAAGSCYAGRKVELPASDSSNIDGVSNLGSHAAASSTEGAAGLAIGRAMNSAASGGFVMLRIGGP